LTQADVGLYFMDDTLLNRTKCPVKLADMVMLGIPVVGEAVGQVPEYVVNGQTGLLRVAGDVDGLIEDVVYLLINREKRRQFSENGRYHYHANFNWSHQADSLTKIYKSTE
ncbi:MAG: glycosyltransferase, partial [Anaerolineae bacterium]|nr:glycosyltransferase [Anaerolineae bacterium]